MASVDVRVAEWVDIMADLLAAPLTQFPTDRISSYLRRSFDADVCTYNWRDVHGQMGLQATAQEGVRFGGRSFLDTQLLIQEQAPGLLDAHPLVRWFLETENPGAQSAGRVPDQIARTGRTGEVLTVFREYEIDQQLSVPMRLRGVEHRAFVVTRRGVDDFSDEDLSVARRVQPMLIGLYVQCELLAAYAPPSPPERLLTGRELAVLHLLADGLTAVAIGHRLSSSPRTVEKHVQSVYRKLEVRDRVSAVREAMNLGFIVPTASRGQALTPAAGRSRSGDETGSDGLTTDQSSSP